MLAVVGLKLALLLRLLCVNNRFSSITLRLYELPISQKGLNLYKCEYMSASELIELRNDVKKYVDHADESVLKIVYAILEEGVVAENNAVMIDLTPEQKTMLRERMERHRQGLTSYSTWDEIEKRIALRAKNAL